MGETIVVDEKASKFSIELKSNKKILFILCCFIFLNALKLTIFNFTIMYSKTIGLFTYKMIYMLLIGLVFYGVVLRIKTRVPLIIFYILQMAYMFAYLSYFNYFKSYLHLFQAAALMTESVGPIVHMSIPINFSMIIIFIDLPIFLLMMIHYKSLGIVNNIIKPKRKYFITVPLLIILCFEGWNFLHDYSLLQIGKNFHTTEPIIIERYGTIANNICDLVYNYGGENLVKSFEYGETVTAFSTNTSHPNIIAIQVESMDANIINKKYNGKYITPYLNLISQNNIYYPYTLSYHKAGGTSDSEFSIINSIEPLSDYPSIKISSYNYPNSMLKNLTLGKYLTLAFHGNVGAFYSRATQFPKMGFNEFYDIDKMKLKNEGWGAPDSDVFNYALKILKKQKGPSLSYIITMSSHMPFTSVSNYYNNKDYNGIKDKTVKNYFNSLSYVDKSIENFIEQIKLNFPNTYILIWGDHTPDINTELYQQASYSLNNKYFEFVPLIIVTPNKKVHHENKNVASFLDIAPTILNISGLRFSIKTDGMNLLNPPNIKPEIPFKEKFYFRSELFNQISKN